MTGGIGSGKSAVAGLLGERGGAVIDADRIGHQALGRPEVIEQVRRAFGDEVLDDEGNIRHEALAAVAFVSAEQVEKLNSIVHPRIIEEVRRRIGEAEAHSEVRFIVLDAALLMETGLDSEVCDALLFVRVDPDLRRERAAAQRGWSQEEMERREALQMSPEQKERAADFVLENNGSREDLRRGVERVLIQIRKRLL